MPKTLNRAPKVRSSVENFSNLTTNEQNELIKQAFNDFKICLLGPNYIGCK